MREDDLDQVLSRDQQIVPSSGFVDSVMEAVHREASTPPPIPFPWIRAVPCAVALCFVLVSIFLLGIEPSTGRAAIHPVPAPLLSAFAGLVQVWRNTDASLITLALILSGAVIKTSTLLVSRQVRRTSTSRS